MKLKSGIYKIINLINNKIYIGSAFNLYNRKNVHSHHLIKNTHQNLKLQRSFNKYKIENFKFEVLEYIEDKTKLIEREQFYIDTLKPEFNICRIAGSSLGAKRDDKFCQNVSNRMKGKYLFKNEKKFKIGNIPWNKGIKLTPDIIKKISDGHKGLPIWNKNVPHTEETKNKISLANKGKKKPNGFGLAISIALKNKPKSEEHKFNQSLSMKGKGVKSVYQYDLNDNFIRKWDSIKDASIQLGVYNIHNSCNNKYKHVGGFKWKYNYI